MNKTWLAVRGDILHFLDDPAGTAPEHVRLDGAHCQYETDGVLLIADGHVQKILPGAIWDAGPSAHAPAGTQLFDYRGKLILPGFVDTHVHYAQTDIIGSYGEQLLTWLEKYTFPEEAKFADRAHADAVAAFFLDELLRNGTTTALAFATVHPQSCDALFTAALQRRMRLLTGKVLMDRHCPPALCDDAASGERDSRRLIETWHGRDRLGYAVTPRFAPTSTPEQMAVAGRLFADYPGVHLQSHVAENLAEVAWVSTLYPEARSYLDVYERYGQLGPRSVFAHCIWLDDADRQRMAATGAAMSFCPTSNLFLGSGLFDLAAARSVGVRVGLGTDIGGGTSLSILRTLAEAYKVLQLRGQPLTAFDAFYLATLGGARSLYLDAHIGNFAPGKEADFVVLDPAATPLLARRMQRTCTLAEKLFVLMTLGDDRTIAATHVMGECRWRRP